MAKIAKYASTCSHGAAQDWFHLKTTYASDIGVQSQLADCPVHCLFEDEVGRVMAASKNPASPGYAIATMIMAAYTKFDSELAEAKRQDQKKTIPAIHYPILTGVGATAPETFLASLDEATLRGGLIGRRLVVPLNPPTRRAPMHHGRIHRPEVDPKSQLPLRLKEAMDRLWKFVRGGECLAGCSPDKRPDLSVWRVGVPSRVDGGELAIHAEDRGRR